MIARDGPSVWRWRGRLWWYMSVLVGALSASAIAVAVDAAVARAAATARYAYVPGTDSPSGNCTSQDSEQCSLTAALSQAQNGDTIYLATPTGVSGGSCTQTGCYVGNWIINKSVLIEPAPGVPSATLDGNAGLALGCSTPACDGPVITVLASVDVRLDDVTIRDADNSLGGFGGASILTGRYLSMALRSRAIGPQTAAVPSTALVPPAAVSS